MAACMDGWVKAMPYGAQWHGGQSEGRPLQCNSVAGMTGWRGEARPGASGATHLPRSVAALPCLGKWDGVKRFGFGNVRACGLPAF